MKEAQTKKRRLSLAPLSFEEAIADILKVGSMPKLPKKRRNAKKRAKTS